MTKFVELYYSVRELALLLRFSETTVRRWIRDGEFGAGVVDIGGDLRVPASAANGFLERHPFSCDAGTRARNVAELRRKLAGKACPDVRTDGEEGGL